MSRAGRGSGGDKVTRGWQPQRLHSRARAAGTSRCCKAAPVPSGLIRRDRSASHPGRGLGAPSLGRLTAPRVPWHWRENRLPLKGTEHMVLSPRPAVAGTNVRFPLRKSSGVVGGVGHLRDVPPQGLCRDKWEVTRASQPCPHPNSLCSLLSIRA